MSRTPINLSDIRKGDLIRWERTPEADGCERAVEIRTSRDGQPAGLGLGGGTYYLLDRPAPPVVLPETPTLGWADGDIGFWNQWQGQLNGRYANGSVANAPLPDTFTEATAVPTEALDALRKESARGSSFNHEQMTIRAFLAAVDEASA